MEIEKSPAGIVIFIVWRELFLMLLRDNKPGLPFANTWTPVTGGLEKGETVVQGGKRECKEELSFVPKHFVTLGVSAKGNGFFFARLTDKEYAKVRLNEGQAFGYFKYEALFNILIGGAMHIYLHRYPGLFEQMAMSGKAPDGRDLGLATWNG